jgi:hypothetical protein
LLAFEFTNQKKNTRFDLLPRRRDRLRLEMRCSVKARQRTRLEKLFSTAEVVRILE